MGNTETPEIGLKYDTEKIRVDLLPPDALLAIAKVMTFGAAKYGDHNWARGMAWHRIYGAALRHLFAWWLGEDNDPESGLPHLSHAGCCVLFLIAYTRRGSGTDTRPALDPFASEARPKA